MNKDSNIRDRKCAICFKLIFKLDTPTVFTKRKKYCDGCMIKYHSDCASIVRKRAQKAESKK